MLDLKRFKEAIMAYGIHYPYVKEILNNWGIQNCIIPKD
jgi:DNA replication protein DnaD